MPAGAVISEGSSGESVSHFAAIRIRMTGFGELRIQVSSLDDMKVKTLVPIRLDTWSRLIPTRLVNFVEQRASFHISTRFIEETFKIHRIVIFQKAIYSSIPSDTPSPDVHIVPLDVIF